MRINIESQWLIDDRRFKLAELVGNIYIADGMMIEAWRMSQELWANGRRLVPRLLFEKIENSEKIIESGLAEVQGNLIYIRGTKEHHEWSAKWKEGSRKGGKKGGGSNKVLKSLENDSKAPTKAQARHEQASLLSSLSSSLSSLSSELSSHDSKLLTLKTINKGSKEKKPPADKSGGSKVWDSYKSEFLKRYGVEPVRNAKVNAQCSQLFSRLGEDAFEVIVFYLKHNDSWFLKNQHDFGSLLAKAESIYTQWLRGQAVTSAQVRDAEKTIHKTTIKNELENLFSETQEG